MQRENNGSKNGDTTAQVEDATELYTRYSGSLYHYCLGRLHSPEEAEDAVQVTYLNAWRSLRRGFEPEQSRAWLYQIAANVCASALRSRLGGTRLELRDPTALDEVAGADIIGNEELMGLPEALRELPSRQRDALLLRDWKGLSYDEIAAEMSVSDAAVETLLFRARKSVATALTNSGWRRKVAPSARALVVSPFLFLRPRAAEAAGAEHLKGALILAGGTVAPLVAFGVMQVLISKDEPPPQAPRQPAVVQVDRARTGTWLAQGAPVHPRPKAEAPRPADKTKPGARHGKRKKDGAHSAQVGTAQPTTGSGTAQPTTGSGGGASTGQDSKIVLCHATKSATKPGVTISVSPNALKGLGQDAAGPCG